MDAERARQRLAEERSRVEQELVQAGGQTLDEPEDFADKAAELEQAETDQGIRAELKQTLEAIKAAEQRIEEGSYGKSVVSGEAIPDGRLEAIPWADRTVEEEKDSGG